MRHFKFLLILFFALFCATSAWGRGDYYKGASTVAAGCVAEELITFWWECETTTPEHSDGDTSAALNYVTLDAAGAKSGTNGISGDGNNHYAQFDTSMDSIFGNSARVGYWLYIDTWVDNGTTSSLSVAGSQPIVNIRNRSTDEMQFVWDNSSNPDFNCETTQSGLSADNWFWIEWYYNDSTTDTIGVKIYNSSLSQVASCSQTGTMDSHTFSRWRLGPSVGGEAQVGKIDHVIVVNDYTQSLTDCADTYGYPY